MPIESLSIVKLIAGLVSTKVQAIVVPRMQAAITRNFRSPKPDLERLIADAVFMALRLQLEPQASAEPLWTEDERRIIAQIRDSVPSLFRPGDPLFPRSVLREFVVGDVAALGTAMVQLLDPHFRAAPPDLRRKVRDRLPHALMAAMGEMLRQDHNRRAWIDFQQSSVRETLRAIREDRRQDGTLAELDPLAIDRLEAVLDALAEQSGYLGELADMTSQVLVRLGQAEATGRDLQEILRQEMASTETKLNALATSVLQSVRAPFYAKYAGGSVAAAVEAVIQERLKSFAGREEQLAALDDFVTQRTNGFLCVQEEVGRGKSALLANWIKRRNHTDVFVAYHFFNERFDDTTDLVQAYRNILRQLFIYCNCGDELPTDAPTLRDAICGILKDLDNIIEPIVIVLDGLDEAKEQVPVLFPVPLPPRVFVLASVRTEAGLYTACLREWPPPDVTMTLPELPDPAVVSLLREAGEGDLAPYANDGALVSALKSKAGGLLLYMASLVEDLVEAARSGAELIPVIQQAPERFEEYMHCQFQLLANGPLKDSRVQKLFAYVTVADGPIDEDDIFILTGLTRTDLLGLSVQVKRWIGRQVSSDSYALSHRLLAEQFCSLLGRDASRAKDQLRDYCRNWRDHGGAYALRYYPAMLLESNPPGFLDLVDTNDFLRRYREKVGGNSVDQLLSTALQIAEEPQRIIQIIGKRHEGSDDGAGHILIQGLRRLAETECGDFVDCAVDASLTEDGYESHQAGQVLADFLKSHTEEKREAAVDAVLRGMEVTDDWKRVKNGVWTLSTIGYRHPDAVTVLERLSGISPWCPVPDDVRDAALDTLVWLGYLHREVLFERLTELLAADSPPSVSIIGALRELAEPSLMDAVVKAYRKWFENAETTRLMGRALVDTVDRHPSLAPSAWREIVASPLEVEVLCSGDLAQKVDDPDVPRHLLQSLEPGLQDGYTNAEYISPNYHLYLRLSELDLPLQLDGMVVAAGSLTEVQLASLAADANLDTRSPGYWQTGPMLSKESCWEVVLRLGLPQAAEWLPQAIKDTSRFVANKLIDVAGYLRLTALIPRLAELVASPETPDTIGRAALRALGRMCEPEAWDALLGSQVNSQGSVPADFPDALCELALSLSDVEPILRCLESASVTPAQWLSCVVALRDVTLSDPTLVSPNRSRVLRLLQQQGAEQLDGTSFLVTAAGSLEPDQRTAAMFVEWACSGSQALRTSSLTTLARWNLLEEQTDLLERLGLVQSGGVWELAHSPSEEEAPVLGLLYRFKPAAFAPALSRLLREQPPEYHFASRYVQAALSGGTDPAGVEDALFTRAHLSNGPARSEPAVLLAIARAFPERFVNEFTRERCADWMADCRETIIEELRGIVLREERRQDAVNSLAAFLDDPMYTARRRAARALSERDAVALRAVVEARMHDGTAQQRAIAVEAASWLPDTDAFEGILAAAQFDTEREVREASKAVWQERRDRRWTAVYLDRVLAAGGDQLLSVWRFGRALADLGDDEIYARLWECAHKRETPANKRGWLIKTADDLAKNWAERERKWRER